MLDPRLVQDLRSRAYPRILSTEDLTRLVVSEVFLAALNISPAVG